MLGPLYIQYPYFYKIHVHVHFEKVDMICTSTLTCKPPSEIVQMVQEGYSSIWKMCLKKKK